MGFVGPFFCSIFWSGGGEGGRKEGKVRKERAEGGKKEGRTEGLHILLHKYACTILDYCATL